MLVVATMRIRLFVLFVLFVSLTTCNAKGQRSQPGGVSSDEADSTESSEETNEDSSSSSSEENGGPRHIVVFLANDFGWNDFLDSDVTPTLTQLSQEGTIFNNSYVQPTGVGTRSALLTGIYPHKTGTQFFMSHFPRQGSGLPTKYTLLSEKLKELNYQTHAVGTWGLGFCNPSYLPTSRGFDTFYGTYTGNVGYYNKTSFDPITGDEGYDFHDNSELVPRDDSEHFAMKTRNRAVDIVKRLRKKNKNPLFLYYSFQLTRSPLEVPQEYLDLFPDEVNPERRAFLAMSYMMDESVYEVARALERKGIIDNTLILFLSDNGGEVSQGGSNLPYRGNKGTLFEGGIRVPTFVWGNMINAGVSSGLIHAIDWLPTIVSFANGTSMDVSDIDGVDQSDMVFNGGDSARDEVFLSLDDDKFASKAAIRVLSCCSTSLPPSMHMDLKLIDGEPSYMYPVRVNSETSHLFPLDPTSPSFTTYTLTLPGATTPESDPPLPYPMALLYDMAKDPSESTNIVTSKILHKLLMQQKLNIERLSAAKIRYLEGSALNTTVVGKPSNNADDAWVTGWCEAIYEPEPAYTPFS